MIILVTTLRIVDVCFLDGHHKLKPIPMHGFNSLLICKYTLTIRKIGLAECALRFTCPALQQAWIFEF